MKKILLLLMLALTILQLSAEAAVMRIADVKISPMKVSELRAVLGAEGYVVVDSRSSGVYNGWREGSLRGGHIPGSINFDAGWLSLKVPKLAVRLDELLTEKGIEPSKTVIVCGDDKDKQELAAWLAAKGFLHVFTCDMKDWIADVDLPLMRFPNFQIVLPPQVLKELTDGRVPETFNAYAHTVIFEASRGDELGVYAQGHVPGAVHFDLSRVEQRVKPLPVSDDVVVSVSAGSGEVRTVKTSAAKVARNAGTKAAKPVKPIEAPAAKPVQPVPDAIMLAPVEKIREAAVAMGVAAGDTVVVTGKKQIDAYRLAFALRCAGIADVRVLDGGQDAWTAAGYRLSKEFKAPSSVSSFGTPAEASDLLMTMNAVRSHISTDEAFALVDARTWREYIGQVVSTGVGRKGRIPGAVFASSSDKPGSLESCLNPDGTMRDVDEIATAWKGLGIDLVHRLCFVSTDGGRASQLWFYAAVMGQSEISVLAENWSGWLAAGGPVEMGTPTKKD